jgi:cell division protein FtsL
MSSKRGRADQPLQVHWTKRIDNSRLVRRPDPNYLRETATLVAGAAACLAILLLCAWQHFAYTNAGYQLEELRVRTEQVREWNRALRLEQAALTDPMRIDLLARTRLGLGAPAAGQLVPLGAGEAAVGMPVLARWPAPGYTGLAPVAGKPARASVTD